MTTETATRTRRSPDQLAAFNKAVKKAVGRAKAGKKFAEIKSALAEELGEGVNDVHLRKALNDLIGAGELTFTGKTRATTYFAV